MVIRLTFLGFLLLFVITNIQAQQGIKIDWIDPTSNNATVTDEPFYLEFNIYTSIENPSIFISKDERVWKLFLQQKNDTTYFVIEQIKLKKGKNEFSLFYKMDDKQIPIDSIVFIKEDEIKKNGGVASSAFSRTDYAIIISNNQYKNWPSLPDNERNINAIAEELEYSYDFKTQIIENLTIYDFYELFDQIFRYGCNSVDQLFVFIESHGFVDSGTNYIVMSDSDPYSKDIETNSALSYKSLISIIENTNCKNVLLILDVLKSKSNKSFDNSQKFADNSLTGKSLIKYSLGTPTKRFITNNSTTLEQSKLNDYKKELAPLLLKALRSYGGNDNILTLQEIMGLIKQTNTQVDFGSFDTSDNPQSDFIFIAK